MCSEKKLLGALVLSVSLLGNAFGKEQPLDTNKYNVLFIGVDDLRAELGCYGVDEISPPPSGQAGRFEHALHSALCAGAALSDLACISADGTKAWWQQL